MSAQQAEMQAAVQEVACQQILDLAKQVGQHGNMP
jgi:hypothetical protein